MFVPVVDLENKPLMPTTPSRAARWIKSRKATPFWKKGVFCVRLNIEPSARNCQLIALGVDPGSKMEGYTVKSEAHTFVNFQSPAKMDVKEKIRLRRDARNRRRQRKTPYRACRANRKCLKNKGLPPSTKARWDLKIRFAKFFSELFPISNIVIEDISAQIKKGKHNYWNKSFSPLQHGKNYGYVELSRIADLTIKTGLWTSQTRTELGLTKSKNKLDFDFSCHCVDSFVLADSVFGNKNKPDNTKVTRIRPLNFHRRQLHAFQPTKGGVRKRYGGTRSLGFKRGSIVRNQKYGVCYVGGNSKSRLSVHSCDGKRLSQNIKAEQCGFLSYASFIII